MAMCKQERELKPRRIRGRWVVMNGAKRRDRSHDAPEGELEKNQVFSCLRT